MLLRENAEDMEDISIWVVQSSGLVNFGLLGCDICDLHLKNENTFFSYKVNGNKWFQISFKICLDLDVLLISTEIEIKANCS